MIRRVLKKNSSSQVEKGRQFMYRPSNSTAKHKLFAPIQRSFKVPVSAAGTRRNHSNLYDGGKKLSMPCTEEDFGKTSAPGMKRATPVASSSFFNQ